MKACGSDSAVVLALVWAVHAMGECTVRAQGCNFTEFLFNEMLANDQYMMEERC